MINLRETRYEQHAIGSLSHVANSQVKVNTKTYMADSSDGNENNGTQWSVVKFYTVTNLSKYALLTAFL